MTNWREKQRNCKICQGLGYSVSELRRPDGRGPDWAVRCSCQPTTFEELAEAASQEEQDEHAAGS